LAWPTFPIVAAALFLCFGCSSAKPSKSPPAPVAAAERTASQAAKLSAKGNWTAAGTQWQSALDRYRLLNDQTNEAIALHNLAEARRQAGDLLKAHDLLESAAAINFSLKIDEHWWRNQIALLQVEAQLHRTNELASRFEKLTPHKIANRSLRALFLNELGLWHTDNGEFDPATGDFRDAVQLFSAEKNEFGTATVLANQGLLLEKKEHFSEAAQKWAEAQKLFEFLADPNGIALAMAGRGRALLSAKQELAQAEDLLRRAERNFRLLHNETRARETAELLKKSNEARENLK